MRICPTVDVLHEISLHHKVTELLYEAEERLDMNADAPVPILKIFLPWILEATTVDEYDNVLCRVSDFHPLTRTMLLFPPGNATVVA